MQLIVQHDNKYDNFFYPKGRAIHLYISLYLNRPNDHTTLLSDYRNFKPVVPNPMIVTQICCEGLSEGRWRVLIIMMIIMTTIKIIIKKKQANKSLYCFFDKCFLSHPKFIKIHYKQYKPT